MIKKIKISNENENTRIDKWLKKNFSTLTQSFIEKSLRKGFIKINKNKIKSDYRLKIKDIIDIHNYTDEKYLHIPKKNKTKKISNYFLNKFNISKIFENDNFIILNKWSGISTQGGSKINISIDDIIKNKSPNYNLVHRLDKETSGLLIIAKNLKSTKNFGEIFKSQKINKVYLAICEGQPKIKKKLIKINIKNQKKSNQSITRYEVLSVKNNISLIVFWPLTGKKHQLRIVAKYIGCPIIGDSKYNTLKNISSSELKLNSYSIKFIFENREYKFFSQLPQSFTNFLQKQNIKINTINKINKLLNLS